MKFDIKIKDISSVDEIPGAWTKDDYITLLDEFNFPNASDSPEGELKALLLMAINDFDPNEAASILLSYKLKDKLTEGQIHQLSHEMENDKISEEYPDISLHEDLFNINQLLYKSYNGKFPKVEATIIELEFNIHEDEAPTVDKEIILRAMGSAFTDRSLIKRLFEEQLNGDSPFPDAESILWKMEKKAGNTYKLTTSDYWLNKEDFLTFEFDGELKILEHSEE